jgi:hypothetical protein
MIISEIKPVGQLTYMYRTIEAGNKKYFYLPWEKDCRTEIYSFTNGNCDEQYWLDKCLLIDVNNPQETVYKFWKLYMLQ